MFFVVKYNQDANVSLFFNHLFQEIGNAIAFVRILNFTSPNESYIILPYKENEFYNFEEPTATWHLMETYFGAG